MAEIEQLKKTRGLIKGKLTRFKNFFSNAANKTEGKKGEIIERLTKFEPLLESFENLQDQIEELCESDDIREVEIEERESFENDYYKYLAEAKDFVSVKAVSNCNEPPVTLVQNPGSILKQLPSITVPKFNGSLNSWIKFRDSFESLVNSQHALSNIDKFNYLNSALEGEAARSIQSLGISDANYDRAWAKLRERYEDVNQLIDYHTQAFCELPHVQKATYTELRRLIDDANNHILALQGLDETAVKCDSLLIYIISKKLDPETKRQWDRRALSLEKRTFAEFIAVVENHCKFLQRDCNAKQATVSQNKGHPFKPKITAERLISHAVVEKGCPACNENHPIYSCEIFKALSIPLRLQRVKELRLCYNCLQSGHGSRMCHSGPCRKCRKKHNTLLHLETVAEATPTPPQPATLIGQSAPRVVSQVLLGTAIIHVEDRSGNMQECRALLDSGSQVHLTTREMCERLQLPTCKFDATVAGINQERLDINQCVKLKLKSMRTEFKATITCLVTGVITDDMPSMNVPRACYEIPTGILLADPRFAETRPVDLLIGAGLFWDLLCVGQIKRGYDQPLLQKTKLGWIATGILERRQDSLRQKRATCNLVTNDLHDLVERFWKLEDTSPFIGPLELDHNHPCERHFKATTKRDPSGRFIVTIPFKEQVEALGSSYNVAYNRLRSMERKFARDAELKEQYISFMRQYEELGHMSEVPDSAMMRDTAFYLPHHGVRKDNSTTTRLRVVFDGSSKTTSGISLNDTQLIGPTVQDELFCIVVRFRKHRVVICADIAKMYRQVQVVQKQRDYQRILFRTDPSEPAKVYRLNTLTYGTACAAYLATRCLREVGEMCKESHPIASKAIIEDFYVDDLISGSENIEKAQQLKKEISTQLKSAGFELRKWASNEPRALQVASQEERTIEADKDPKTLGLRWITESDTLNFIVDNSDQRVCKRTILSQIAKIFDPLGLVGPVTARAKIILERVWQLKLDWDESLPQDLYTSWIGFQGQLVDLHEISIPRRVLCDSPIRVEMHGFCDASEAAYGACIYLRSTDQQGNHTVRLLCAKSKVAPLKKVSLPRLELCGATLLAQLAHKVTAALDMSIDRHYFWSDSTITLAWIKAPASRWKTFVANRTSEIQRLVGSDWRHVASKDNPADLISRGANASDLLESTLWWEGPHWLGNDTRTFICVFVCLATKAIHIELAHDLSTEAFLNCLRRFVSRRGRLRQLDSDDGTNFVGARNELRKLGYLLTDKNFESSVVNFSAERGMSWHMNPPRAANFGGIWESCVKSVKFHLKRVIGDARLTYEELYTVSTQIEACLNSRPLSPISSDPNDLTPLTPAHFLIGESMVAVPEADVRDLPMNRLDRYQLLRHMLQTFWQRWQKEYLHHLQQRQRWKRPYPNTLSPGTMVIVKEDNLPPTRWRLGRIIKVFPGQDDVIRVASVKVADGTLVRPASKIVPLPFEVSGGN